MFLKVVSTLPGNESLPHVSELMKADSAAWKEHSEAQQISFTPLTATTSKLKHTLSNSIHKTLHSLY